MRRRDADLQSRRTLLLFFHEFESDKFIPYDRYLKRIVRPVYNRLHSKQKKTGFGVWFERLTKSLQLRGYFVSVNDYRSARAHPWYPVGLVGYPNVLEHWDLPNPAVLGPGMFDHPMLAPHLMADRRFRYYIITCDWMYRLFYPFYGETLVMWQAGIDLNDWPDTSSSAKDIDFLIYDKLRWDRDERSRELLYPIEQTLHEYGFRTHLIRYKQYDHAQFKKLLARSRAMVFLCEHESQGMAYQEALASNVPVLAWDNGYWLDPRWKQLGQAMVPASSVPQFSDECGSRFTNIHEFEPALKTFMDRLPTFCPRRFVAERLNMTTSADIYTKLYFSLLG